MIKLWGLALTLIVYIISKRLQKYKFFAKIPPMVISGIFIIVFLKIFNIEYSNYNESACFYTIMLGPATVALAYPLYENLSVLKKNKRAVWFGFLVAVITALSTTFVIGSLLHTDRQIITSLVPKTVTNPIAVEISKSIGGIPELTACMVVMTGVFGALFGHKILKTLKIKSDTAIGLAIGACSHVLGTSICIEKKRKIQVVMSTLALIIIGLLTTFICLIIF